MWSDFTHTLTKYSELAWTIHKDPRVQISREWLVLTQIEGMISDPYSGLLECGAGLPQIHSVFFAK